MIMTKSRSLQYLCTAGLVFLSAPCFAQNNPVVLVNGEPISQAMFEQNLRANLPAGQQVTPDLQRVVLDELINREVQAQEAVKLGLDKTPEGQLQLKQVRDNALVELLTQYYIAKNPVTEVDVTAQYEREIAAINAQGGLQQYKIALMVLPNEAQAHDVLVKLRKGESFEKLASAYSIDPSRTQGGQVGWVLPNQINPVVAGVMVNMGKGSTSATAVQTSAGWNIIKVEDKRPFKAPSFEQAKNQIRVALIQQRRAEYIKQLRDQAKITQ